MTLRPSKNPLCENPLFLVPEKRRNQAQNEPGIEARPRVGLRLRDLNFWASCAPFCIYSAIILQHAPATGLCALCAEWLEHRQWSSADPVTLLPTLSFSFSVSLSLSLSVSLCPSHYLALSFLFSLCFSLSASLSFFVLSSFFSFFFFFFFLSFFSLSLSLSLCLSVCLSVRLSVSVCLCLCLCLSVEI